MVERPISLIYLIQDRQLNDIYEFHIKTMKMPMLEIYLHTIAKIVNSLPANLVNQWLFQRSINVNLGMELCLRIMLFIKMKCFAYLRKI